MAPTLPQRDPARRDLPAAYISPWRLLGQDLRAVAASVRLKLQELSRRNASGELPRPGFWPAPLAAWFWPLLLGLTLAVFLVLVFPGQRGLAVRSGPPVVEPLSDFASSDAAPYTNPEHSPSAGYGAGEAEALNPVELAQPDGLRPEQPVPSVTALEPQHRDAEGQDHPVALDEPGRPRSGALTPAGPPEALPLPGATLAPLGQRSAVELESTQGAFNPAPLSPPSSLNPAGAAGPTADLATQLLELLRTATPEAPPLAAGLGTASVELLVRTAPAFEQAPRAMRQAWANRWWDVAREQGFSQLTLLDPAGRPLGRQARAGSGMILLQPFSEPP